MAEKISNTSIKAELILQATTSCLTNDKANMSGGAVKGWATTDVDIFWDVKFVNTGPLEIAVQISNDEGNAGAEIEAEVNGKKVSAFTKFSGGWKKFDSLTLGTVSITDPGLNRIKIRAKKIKGVYAGDMSCVKLKGPAIKNAVEDVIPSRADSIHLTYEDGGGCGTFYNQVKVTSSYPGTFFVVCGFNRGYFGMQENNFEGKKTVLFSVWDSGCKDEDDPDKIPDEERTRPICHGDDVLVKRFGNEGTGCQGFFNYSWNLNENYHFLVKATAGDDSKSMTYSGFFYLNETSQWKHIASYEVKCKVERMTGLHTFVEDYLGGYGRNMREALFGPGWRRMPNGDWIELTESKFSQAGTLPNTDAGVINMFYLRTGGRTIQTNPVGSKIAVKPTGSVGHFKV